MVTWINSLQLAVLCAGCVLSATVFILVALIRRAFRKPRCEYGTTIKCGNMEPHQVVVNQIQPGNLVLSPGADSDPVELKMNRGLAYKTYSTLRRQSAVSLASSGRSSLDGWNRPWQLSVKLWYKRKKQRLYVNIAQAVCLPENERFREMLTSSVYVQVSLSTDKSKVFCTNTYSNTGSPAVDETFKFTITPELLVHHEVKLTLVEMDFDRTRLYQGNLTLQLQDYSLDSGKICYVCKDLDQICMTKGYVADAMLSLCYRREKQRLDVQIYAVRDVAESREDFKTYYLKLQIMTGTRVAKEKTTNPIRTVEAAMTCHFGFGISPRAIETCSIRFALIGVTMDDKERTLGEFVVGPRCGPAASAPTSTKCVGVQHWKEMLLTDGRHVECWHKLKPPAETNGSVRFDLGDDANGSMVPEIESSNCFKPNQLVMDNPPWPRPQAQIASSKPVGPDFRLRMLSLATAEEVGYHEEQQSEENEKPAVILKLATQKRNSTET